VTVRANSSSQPAKVAMLLGNQWFRKEKNRRGDGKHTQERGRSIAGGGMVRLVDTLRPPLRISRDLVVTR
jgi:hypothetical protein